MSAPSQSEGDTGAREFTMTHWSVVLSAGRDSSAQASDALAKLCRVYWWPLYAFVRRQGHSPDTDDRQFGAGAKLRRSPPSSRKRGSQAVRRLPTRPIESAKRVMKQK